MSRNPIITIAASLLLTIAISPTGTNGADLVKEIESQQKKIKRVQEEIEEHRERVRDTRIKETNLFDQLEIIDQAIRDGRKQLADLREEISDQEKRIAEKAEELAFQQAEKEEVKKHVQDRLAAFYRMGDLDMTNVAFSAGSLPDLLNFNEYFKAMVKYDQKVIDEYRIRIESLLETQEALEDQKNKLLETIETVKEQEINLSNVRQERVALLTKVNTEKKLYRRAIEEMEEASTRLAETLTALRQKMVSDEGSLKGYYSSPKKRKPGTPRPLSAMKGKLLPPVRGSVTTFYGKNKQGKFGIDTESDGIDIKTLAGIEIKAIYSGKVAYAGPLKGYGNLIIIDHGYQYYSLVSRAAELYKKEGDQVSTGEVIGIMNEAGGLLGEGLHFEIRHGTEPQDPLDWVDRKLLNISQNRAAVLADNKKVANN